MKKPIPFGKYYLLDRVSVGGMAEVFKAKAFGVEGFERLIAVKRILPSIAEDEEFITMFIDEAKIAVQLQHANIAQIFDLGKVGESYFIALEYVSGKDLRTIFERLRNNGRAIPINMAAYITMKVCEGLDYAHNKKDAAGRDLNLVHRDVSPQNILVSHDGEIKIIDFGIAKAAGKAGKTQAGILKGKFGYMSPEQVRGLPLDRRSDIFAVGICLWELVTGERLFVGESDFSTLEKVRNVEITPPSTYNQRVPRELESIILKALSKEVEDRYQSAMDLHDDLQSWMYTSGNFFARKDLGVFMYEAFRSEIDKEAANSEGEKDIIRSTVPPPPKAALRASQSISAFPMGAPPPPPRVSHPPAIPGTHPGGPNRPTPRFPGPPAAGIAPSRPVPPGSRPAPPDGRVYSQPPVKRTMLGMPAPPVARGGQAPISGPPPVAGRHISNPPNLPMGSQAPMMPGQGPSLGMDDWDEDEPPTNIYTKETAAEMAQAAVAMQGRSGGMDVPLSAGGPPYQDMMPQTSQNMEAHRERRRSAAPTFIGVFAALMVLGILGAVFFLKVRIVEQKATLELEVQPADKLSIVIDGARTLPGTRSPFKINDLTPGSHFLTVQRSGYKDLQVEVGIQAGQTVSRSLALEQVSTGFFLETDPPGASVWIDDRPLDSKTPITVNDLEAGTYRVRIAKGEEYAQKTIEVEIKEGEIKTLPTKTLDLKTVEVTFVTEPTGAAATLMSGSERTAIGTTPTTTRLDTSKEYKVKYSKDGYTEVITPIEYTPGKNKITLATVTLWQKKTTPVTRTRPPRVVRTPKPPKAAGPRKPVEQSTPRDTGSTDGKMGTISVQTRPWSKVYINGQFIKNTPLVNHKLKPGSYRITVENPNYNIKKNFRATIKPGKPTTLVKTLI